MVSKSRIHNAAVRAEKGRVELEVIVSCSNFPASRLHILFKYMWNVKTDHILEHIISLNAYQKTEILQIMFSDHNEIK